MGAAAVTSKEVKAGDTVAFTVEPAEGYVVVDVKVGETVLEDVDGTYTTAALNANVTVTVTTRKAEGHAASVMTADGGASNLTLNKTVIEAPMLSGAGLILKANEGYKLPTTLDGIMVNGTLLENSAGQSDKWSYSPSTGAITFTMAAGAVTGPVQIIASAVKVYTITASGANLKAYTAVNVGAGTDFTSIGTDGAIDAIEPKDANFALPSTITVKMGNTTLVSGTDYDYVQATGVITFKGSKTMTDNITIEADAAAIEIPVTAVTNVTFTPAKVNKGTDLKDSAITVAAADGYTLGEITAVSVNGGSALTKDTDYTVTDGTAAGTKVITFLTEQVVTSAIAITVTATQASQG